MLAHRGNNFRLYLLPASTDLDETQNLGQGPQSDISIKFWTESVQWLSRKASFLRLPISLPLTPLNRPIPAFLRTHLLLFSLLSADHDTWRICLSPFLRMFLCVIHRYSSWSSFHIHVWQQFIPRPLISALLYSLRAISWLSIFSSEMLQRRIYDYIIQFLVRNNLCCVVEEQSDNGTVFLWEIYK